MVSPSFPPCSRGGARTEWFLVREAETELAAVRVAQLWASVVEERRLLAIAMDETAAALRAFAEAWNSGPLWN